MPRLEPFRGVRYGDDAGDHGELLAPPYDVVDADQARELRSRSPLNAVHLVLPEGDAPERYELASRRLEEWMRDGVLVREDRPCLYVYGQTFRHRGRELSRHAVVGALRLSAFGDGEVLPHEETHRGPKEDRLALMRACRAQLSPVFLVAPDPARRTTGLVDRATTGPAVVDARTPDGIRHRLWRVVEGPLSEEIREVVGARPLLIADGHHRYETALELGRGTPVGHPARLTLACVVSASDPGLLCLPTHRALSRPPATAAPETGGGAAAGGAGGAPVGRSGSPETGEGTMPGEARDAAGSAAERWLRFLDGAFELRRAGAGAPDDVARAAAEAERPAVLVAGEDGGFLLRARGSGERGTGKGRRGRDPDRIPAAEARGGGPDGGTRADARRAGRDGGTGAEPAPVLFDRLVLRRGWELGPDPAVERGLLSYHRDPAGAVQAAGEEGAAFLLPPPDVDAVWEAARRGRRMPPKSTYFWPKLPSGLLFRLLDR